MDALGMDHISVVDLVKALPTTRRMRLPMIQKMLPSLSAILWPEPPPKVRTNVTTVSPIPLAKRIRQVEPYHETGNDTFIDTRVHIIHSDERKKLIKRSNPPSITHQFSPEWMVRTGSEPTGSVGEFGFVGTDDELAAAARIQSMQRGKQTRREIQEQQAAATRLQSVHRGKAARQQVTMQMESVQEDNATQEDAEVDCQPSGDRFSHRHNFGADDAESEETKAGFPV
eukprot:SAG11_NODE_7530_length_1134_cov_1.245411_2_plen_228_part_00